MNELQIIEIVIEKKVVQRASHTKQKMFLINKYEN